MRKRTRLKYITPKQVLDLVPEQAFLTQVINYARMLGWLTAHFRPARTDRGWRTPVQGDGTGFPDLVLVRDRVIFVETKSARGRISNSQRIWQNALINAGAEYYVWTPREWETIEAVLKRDTRVDNR